jgi:putative endonuclease
MYMPFFVYILASKRSGTLYIGVTNNLARRVAEHKAKLVPGFTRKYGVDLLVYFEGFDSILEARISVALPIEDPSGCRDGSRLCGAPLKKRCTASGTRRRTNENGA